MFSPPHTNTDSYPTQTGTQSKTQMSIVTGSNLATTKMSFSLSLTESYLLSLDNIKLSSFTLHPSLCSSDCGIDCTFNTGWELRQNSTYKRFELFDEFPLQIISTMMKFVFKVETGLTFRFFHWFLNKKVQLKGKNYAEEKSHTHEQISSSDMNPRKPEGLF